MSLISASTMLTNRIHTSFSLASLQRSLQAKKALLFAERPSLLLLLHSRLNNCYQWYSRYQKDPQSSSLAHLVTAVATLALSFSHYRASSLLSNCHSIVILILPISNQIKEKRLLQVVVSVVKLAAVIALILTSLSTSIPLTLIAIALKIITNAYSLGYQLSTCFSYQNRSATFFEKKITQTLQLVCNQDERALQLRVKQAMNYAWLLVNTMLFSQLCRRAFDYYRIYRQIQAYPKLA